MIALERVHAESARVAGSTTSPGFAYAIGGRAGHLRCGPTSRRRSTAASAATMARTRATTARSAMGACSSTVGGPFIPDGAEAAREGVA